MRRLPIIAALCAALSTAVATFAEPVSAQTLTPIVEPKAPRLRPPLPAAAKKPLTARTHAERTEILNQNTVTVISGNPNGTYLFLAYDLSAVLDDGDNLRILPVVGKGAYQNVLDILHLRGVDLGITQSDILSHLKKSGEFGSGVDQRLAYVAKLFNEEMHILAGPGIEKIEDLAGKPVNFSDAGSGTQFSARLIFDLLGIKITEINVGQNDAFLKIKSGEIAATVLLGGKPTAAYAKFKLEPGMKLLPITYAGPLEQDYFPAVLRHEDYPNLIEPGKSVETIAVGAVLAVYNWPRDTDRYRRLARFVDQFFEKFEKFQQPPRHVKWQETNLAATLKGWTRLPAANERLAQLQATTARQVATGSIDPNLVRQQTVKAAPGDASEQERLFREFLEWRKTQKRQ